jgi:hypothetical protein
MSHQAYESVLNSLNAAVEIMERNRTPDPALIAAFDTLKQARAMVIRAVQEGQPSLPAQERQAA